MHEAGIAQSILDIAVNTAKRNSARKITLVAVRIGKMSAVDEASLRFAFEALKADTMARDAVFDYTEVPLKGKCLDCGTEEEFEGYFMNCLKCGSSKVSLISGSELEVSHIEVE